MDILAYSCGRSREAVSHCDQAAFHASSANRSVSLVGFLYNTSIACTQALALQLLGRLSDAAKLVEEGLRNARASRHLYSVGLALVIGAHLCRERREPERALSYAEQAIALARENGFANWDTRGRFERGWALTELGQHHEGIIEMEKGIADMGQIGGAPYQQFRIAVLAHTYIKTGRTEEALTKLNAALQHIERTGDTVNKAEILRLQGEMFLILDNRAINQAENCFRSGLQVARQQEAKWWELRTIVSLARLLRETNRRGEAHTMLGEIYNWFTEGFDLPDLKDAKTLLDELRS